MILSHGVPISTKRFHGILILTTGSVYDCTIVLLMYNVEIGREGGVALGKDLVVKEILQTLR